MRMEISPDTKVRPVSKDFTKLDFCTFFATMTSEKVGACSDIPQEVYQRALAGLEADELYNLRDLIANVKHAFATVNWRSHPIASFRVTVMSIDAKKDMNVWMGMHDEPCEQYSVSRLKGFPYVVMKTLVELGLNVGIARDNSDLVLFCSAVDEKIEKHSIPFGKTGNISRK